MNFITQRDESLEKKQAAGVQFQGTRTGKLDESEIPNDDYEDHYLYPDETKSDSSYAVVSADGYLMRGNVESAYQLGARGGVSEDDLHSKLQSLNDEFDNPPIEFEESMKFEKHVEIAKADAGRRVVTGVVMIPNEVDTQGDFERPETIESLSEGFMERLAAGDAQSGVMHAAFPDRNVLSHVENRVLTTPEKIGDEEYPAGTWLVGKKVRDDSLWQLIETGTLTGFSIGGTVHEVETHAVDGLPDDVAIDDELAEAAEGAEVNEITKASIHEISIVDTPAVQRATIQTAKADDLSKASDALTESVDVATEYLVEQRGHDPDNARELAAFLNREKSGSDSWLSRAKKFFTGSDDGSDSDSLESEKAGRTLSASNMQSAMAVHDTALDLLGSSDVDHGRLRFSDDPTVDFDIGGYGPTSDERAESRQDSILESMDETELKSLIEEVVDEKMADEDDQTEEKTEEKPSDLEEIKSMIADLKESSEDGSVEDEEKAEESDDNEELKAMLGQIASAQGVSQQADTDAETNGAEWAKTFGTEGV